MLQNCRLAVSLVKAPRPQKAFIEPSEEPLEGNLFKLFKLLSLNPKP